MPPRIITSLLRYFLLWCGFSGAVVSSFSLAQTNSNPLPYPAQLVVGSELDFPPFALVKGNNEADGFTVDLWKAVAKEAGLNSVIRVGPFHAILEGFKSGDVDVMINLAQSAQRATFCNFAVPHVTMYGAIFVRRSDSSIKSEADLPGKSIIVLNRDLPHDYAISRGWTNHLILVDDAAAGLQLLASGKHDAMLIGKLVGLNTLREKNIQNVHPVGERLNSQQKFAFALMQNRPGSSELLARINEGLALVKANGTYDLLYEKWFGVLEPREFNWKQALKFLIPVLLVALLASGAYVTERRIRLRLNRVVSLVNATLESTADGIVAVDESGVITALNQKVQQLGLLPPGNKTSDRITGEAFFNYLMGRLRNAAEFRTNLDRVSQSGETETFDTLRFEDGRIFEVASNPQQIDAKLRGRVWSFRDVTRREQAAERIRQFNQELEMKVKERTVQLELAGRDLERLSQVASRTRNGVIICDPEGRIEWVNQGFQATSEWELSEIKGRKPGHFLQGAGTDPEVAKAIHNALIARKSIQFTILNYTKSGRTYWIEGDISPVFDPSGALVSFISVQSDVTERREAAETLRQQSGKLQEMNAHLERALRSRDSFMAAMSHELRTPLHGILGLTEMLLDRSFGAVSEKQERSLERIQESGKHLLELINDILDLARIQDTGVALELGNCDVRETCEAAVRILEPSIREKNQKITVTLPPHGVRIRADVRRTRQILVNLLSNAVKFTPRDGLIGIDVTADAHEMRFEVWDTGMGIPDSLMGRLFQPFVQLDDRLSREHTGSGLGLALVRQLADAHGGRVEVRSRVGEGSRFIVVLPWEGSIEPGTAKTVPAALPPPPKIPIPADLVILVAEDNPVNLFTLKSFLELQDATVLTAENGRQALMIAEKRDPDIILMDIQMARMDGLEATMKIRALNKAWMKSVPIIAVTALAMPGDRERCLAAGATEYMTKPLQMRELGCVIGRLVAATPRPTPASA